MVVKKNGMILAIICFLFSTCSAITVSPPSTPAFSSDGPIRGRHAKQISRTGKKNHEHKFTVASPMRKLRGGAGGVEQSLTALPLSDFTGAARSLFENMRVPASLIGGATVPLGFLGACEVEPGDSKIVRIAKRLYVLVALASLSSQITSIVYATIAINKLSETVVPMTESVMALLKSDRIFELAWVGTNVHFLLGMFYFALLLGFRVWFVFGPQLGRTGIMMASSVILYCLSIVNSGVAMGDGTGVGSNKFGSSFLGLCYRYFVLLASDLWNRRGILQVASIGVALGAVYNLLRKTDLTSPPTK